jgi:hypothetical protein
MVKSPVGPRTRNDCVGESQQKCTLPDTTTLFLKMATAISVESLENLPLGDLFPKAEAIHTLSVPSE